MDQLVWNNLIDEIGAGPKGLKIGKITSGNLEPKILQLVGNPRFKSRAKALARKIERERTTGRNCVPRSWGKGTKPLTGGWNRGSPCLPFLPRSRTLQVVSGDGVPRHNRPLG
jgi:hypothetical protein